MSNRSDQTTGAGRLQREGFVVRKERLYARLIAGAALLTILVTVGIVLALSGRAITFWTEVSPVAFFTGTKWSPIIDRTYGVLPLVSGTLLVTVSAAVIALPVGLGAAVYLSEYASERARSVLKPALEVLAGVPTVIYGYMALAYVTPLFQGVLPISATIIPSRTTIASLPERLPVVPDVLAIPEFVLFVPSLRTFNVLSASIVVGIMIIPMVSSISEDALSAVPDDLRDAAYGLGSTKFDVSTRVVVPAATSGIVASYVLALSRAIGETMAVTMAMGMSPKIPYFPDVFRNFAESSQTITAAMVQIASADSLGGVAYESMFALGMTLFAITLLMNLVAELVRRRFKEAYE